jgi:DNA-binding transcriptional LysR family regulator
MLDPHRLRVFRSVIASGSVQAAADNLRMTSSAVSQHLSALQRETGLTLFEKAGRGIVPTPAARALDEATDDLMAQVSRVDQVVADLVEGRSGRVTLGYFASAGATWMPELVRELTTELPDVIVDLVLTEEGFHGSLPDLDLTITPPDTRPPPGYRRVDLVTDPFVVALHRDHPLATRESLALVELRGERFVSNDLTSSDGHRLVLAACAAAGFRPRFAVQAQDFWSALAFVGADVGVSILPGLTAFAAPPSVVLVPIDEPTPIRHIAALIREVGTPNRAAELALDLLLDLAGHSPIRAF